MKRCFSQPFAGLCVIDCGMKWSKYSRGTSIIRISVLQSVDMQGGWPAGAQSLGNRGGVGLNSNILCKNSMSVETGTPPFCSWSCMIILYFMKSCCNFQVFLFTQLYRVWFAKPTRVGQVWLYFLEILAVPRRSPVPRAVTSGRWTNGDHCTMCLLWFTSWSRLPQSRRGAEHWYEQEPC